MALGEVENADFDFGTIGTNVDDQEEERDVCCFLTLRKHMTG